MIRSRRAFALPAAIAALIVLSALAALASVAARVSLREAAALAAEAQSSASRAAVRARASLVLAHAARSDLLAGPRLIAAQDTVVTTVALAWPWHRVTVTVAGAPLIAELARATAPSLPWCAAVVVGGTASIAAGAVSLDPASSCTELQHAAPVAALAAFSDSIAADLLLAPLPDSVTVYSAGVSVVLRARRSVVISAGATVTGLVIAPNVSLAPGAVVRGMIIATDAVNIAAGAAAIGDERAAENAMFARAVLHFLGRAGLLLPP